MSASVRYTVVPRGADGAMYFEQLAGVSVSQQVAVDSCLAEQAYDLSSSHVEPVRLRIVLPAVLKRAGCMDESSQTCPFLQFSNNLYLYTRGKQMPVLRYAYMLGIRVGALGATAFFHHDGLSKTVCAAKCKVHVRHRCSPHATIHVVLGSV